VRLETGAYAELDDGPPSGLLLHPSGGRLVAQRTVALPRLRGRAPEAIPANADGFVAVDPHGRVAGVEDVWAAGDGTSFPVKHGGLAAEQADAAAADIAVAAGAVVERTPFRPVLRAQVLTPSGPCYLRRDAAGGSGEGEASAQPLWLPPGKIARRWLAPWLAASTTGGPGPPPARGRCARADRPASRRDSSVGAREGVPPATPAPNPRYVLAMSAAPGA
jgi:sulfide:quinone oxidoreductase